MNYIRDKDLVKIVIFPYFLGTLALNGITAEKENFFKLCRTFYLEILESFGKKDRLRKINKRLDILTGKAIFELMNKQNRQINTHKAIIATNIVAQMAMDNNIIALEFAEKLISLLEPFQELEAKMVMSDDEWLTLRKSAEKQAKKIYEVFYGE